jgi:hypothetical protein
MVVKSHLHSSSDVHQVVSGTVGTIRTMHGLPWMWTVYVLSRHWRDCQECGLFGTVLTSICTIRTIHGLTGGWTVHNMYWPVYVLSGQYMDCRESGLSGTCTDQYMYYQDNAWIARRVDSPVHLLTSICTVLYVLSRTIQDCRNR